MASQTESRITVRVQPGAGRSEVVKFQKGCWHIRIAAAPVKGKANQELVKYLSDVLDVSKSHIAILKGETSRNKVVAVSGLMPDQIQVRLKAMLEKP